MLEIDAPLREPHGGHTTIVSLQAFPDGELHLEGAGRSLRLAARALRLGGRAADGSRALQLADGAVVAIAASPDFERWLARQRGDGAGLAFARARRIGRALASLALSALALLAIVRFAVPGLAWVATRGLPYAADEALGAEARRALDDSLPPTALPGVRRAELAALFERVSGAAQLSHPARLELRAGGELGANALALPGGTVVVTDELVALAGTDDELAGVLAHELGHLERRHGLRAALQALGIGALAAGALGDFEGSGLASAGPLLLQLEYSRGFEREADAFAREVLRASRIDPGALGRMLVRLEQADGGSGLPAYLSTHPPSEERARRLGD